MNGTPQILIVEARFYEDIADELARGACEVLDEAGVGYTRLAVPGVFEVPAAARFAVGSASGRYAGVIALGCVIRGETDHYEHICREASRALMDISLDPGLPLGFGILTCETLEQAAVRAAVDKKNKGADIARACLRMMEIKNSVAPVSS